MPEVSKYVIMCVGFTHSGKTTFAKTLVKDIREIVLLDNDEIATFINEKYPLAVFSDYNKVKRTYKEPNLKFLVFQEIFKFCLRAQLNVIHSSGNLGKDSRQFIKSNTKKYKNMFDIDRWQEIWFTITHNKSRSVLTAFGVFWGMFMLVVMVGAGVALQRGMSKNIEGFATNSMFVWAQQTSVPYKGFIKGRNWDMDNEDIGLLINKIPEIQYLAPVLFGGGSPNNVTRNDKSGSYGVKGNYPAYNQIDESKMIYGRYINDIDIAEKQFPGKMYQNAGERNR